MVHSRELESVIRNIRHFCMEAIDEQTGRIDVFLLREQTPLLRKWIYDFENVYVAEAKSKPFSANQIAAEGKKIVDEAWQMYEALLDMEIKANEPPHPTEYEQIPSGVVKGAVKAETIIMMRNLSESFTAYRKNILKS